MRGDRDGTAGFLMAGQRRGVFEVDEDRALEALRLARGDAYDIGVHRGAWTAISRDVMSTAPHRRHARRPERRDPRRLGARGHAVTGADRPALRVVGGAEDSVVRRRRFEEAHPEAGDPAAVRGPLARGRPARPDPRRRHQDDARGVGPGRPDEPARCHLHGRRSRAARLLARPVARDESACGQVLSLAGRHRAERPCAHGDRRPRHSVSGSGRSEPDVKTLAARRWCRR